MTKILTFILELIGWLQIMFFPSLLGLILGATVYYYKHDFIGLILGIGILIAGLVAGILLANRIQKKQGTINFLSRVKGAPTFNKSEIERNKFND